MAAVEAAARAPHAEHLSVSALHLLQAVARRLAASRPEARAEPPAAALLLNLRDCHVPGARQARPAWPGSPPVLTLQRLPALLVDVRIVANFDCADPQGSLWHQIKHCRRAVQSRNEHTGMHTASCACAFRQDWELDGRGRARLAAAAMDAAADDESLPAEDSPTRQQQSAAAPRRVVGLSPGSRLQGPDMLFNQVYNPVADTMIVSDQHPSTRYTLYILSIWLELQGWYSAEQRRRFRALHAMPRPDPRLGPSPPQHPWCDFSPHLMQNLLLDPARPHSMTTRAPARRSLESAAAENPWGFLMGAFAEVARHDPRPRVADAAAAALAEVVEAHCRGWDEPCWQAAYVSGHA